MAISWLLAACGGGGSNEPDASVPIDADVRGTLSLSWTINDADSAEALACDDVGGAAVSVAVLPTGGLVGTVESFPCADGAGTSALLAPGNYDLTFRLVSSAGELATVELEAVALAASGMEPVAIEFPVVARGDFTFTLDAEATAGNCAAVDQDGAGIVEVQMALFDREQPPACIPTTFDVGGQTYETTCSDEVFDGCIESDTAINVTGAPSGSHSLRITASRAGDLPCYRGAPLFGVIANDNTTNLGAVRLGLDDTIAGCAPEEMIDAGP